MGFDSLYLRADGQAETLLSEKGQRSALETECYFGTVIGYYLTSREPRFPVSSLSLSVFIENFSITPVCSISHLDGHLYGDATSISR